MAYSAPLITVEDLLQPDERWRDYASQPEMDPLTEDGALQEAQLLDVRIDALRSTVGLLFELRTALQLREANTGVLVARGLRELAWSAGQRSTPRTAWTVGGSVTSNADRLFSMTIGMWPTPGAQLRIVAERAAFFTGDVPGLERIPNYGTDDESAIQANVAGWSSRFSPVHAVFLDSAPAG
jgi:hypothetical protein